MSVWSHRSQTGLPPSPRATGSSTTALSDCGDRCGRSRSKQPDNVTTTKQKGHKLVNARSHLGTSLGSSLLSQFGLENFQAVAFLLETIQKDMAELRGSHQYLGKKKLKKERKREEKEEREAGLHNALAYCISTRRRQLLSCMDQRLSRTPRTEQMVIVVSLKAILVRMED